MSDLKSKIKCLFLCAKRIIQRFFYTFEALILKYK